jgi:hypothetical protein
MGRTLPLPWELLAKGLDGFEVKGSGGGLVEAEAVEY